MKTGKCMDDILSGTSGKFREFFPGECKSKTRAPVYRTGKVQNYICDAAIHLFMRQVDKIQDGFLEHAGNKFQQ